MNKLYALNGRVIIEPITEETTSAGLLVQTSSDIKAAKGRVINISTLVWNEFCGKHVLMPTGDLLERIEYPHLRLEEDAYDGGYPAARQTHYVSVGDIVIYEKLSAFEVKLDNETLHIVDRRSILAILREETNNA